MEHILEETQISEANLKKYDDKIFDKLKQKINRNSNLIKKANEVDARFSENEIDPNMLISIINNYKRCDFQKEGKNIIVFYNGSPYLTLNLLLQSVLKNDKLLLVYDEYMQGVNEVLISIFKSVLREYNAEEMIGTISKITSQLIKDVNQVDTDVLVLGDTSIYQSLKNARFFPYNNFILYSDNERFDSLKEAIYMYTTQYEYELEVIYEDDLSIVIDEVNRSEADKFILLSDNEESKDRVKNEIKNTKIYINENPFKDDTGIIDFCL